MDRLSAYLTRSFLAQALTIFAAGGMLIWMMQLLRLFDLVSAKGQSLFILAGQSALTTPTFARAILYVCFAIGLVRGLRALQNSRELHTIHAGQRVGALWRAIAVFTLGGVVAVSAIAHWIEPVSKRASAEWSAQIAGDIVGRALVPGRFSEIDAGLVFAIGGRQPDGTLSEFFFDDATNPDTRRTYFARTASIHEDDEGYQLVLNDGAIQYHGRETDGFSQIGFAQYHISLASLTDPVTPAADIAQTHSLALLAELAGGTSAEPALVWAQLHSRTADALRAVAMCLLAAALCAFPDGNRRSGRVPIEIVILAVAFAEQAVTAFAVPEGGSRDYIASIVLIGVAALILWRRLSRADAALRWRWRRA